MLTEGRSLVKRGVPLLLIGLSVFLFYLYFFVGMADIAVIIHRANLFYFSLAVVAVLVSMTFYSLAWQRLLSLLSIKTTPRKTVLFTWIGTFVDLLVPAESISGEISRAYLMSKSSGENAGKVVASVISHRILSMTVTLSGLIIGSVFFILRYEPSGLVFNLIIIVATGTAISLFFVCYLCLREEATEKMVHWLIRFLAFISKGRWQLTRLRSKAQEMLRAFHEGIAILTRSPKSLAWPVALSVAAWFFDLLIALLVFVSLGFQVSLSAILIVYSIGCAIQTIPLGIPGEVGLVEIVMTSLYTLLGIHPAISAAATVLTRAITLWFKLLVGYIAVQWVGLKVLMGSAG
ncbi:MAG: YbhN family protein [Candidatus Bathyarchaeia archaeon]